MLYRYTAIDRAGVTQKGERESPDEKTLSRTLRGEGLLLTAAAPAPSAAAASSPLAFFSRLARFQIGGASLFERMIFARNLAVMIGAGLSMTRALEAQEEQARAKRFKEIVRQIREKILSGVSFAESLEPHRKVFGDFFIHMVEAGEASGKLEGSLKLLARQMNKKIS